MSEQFETLIFGGGCVAPDEIADEQLRIGNLLWEVLQWRRAQERKEAP